jgi:cell division septation protein DedD
MPYLLEPYTGSPTIFFAPSRSSPGAGLVSVAADEAVVDIREGDMAISRNASMAKRFTKSSRGKQATTAAEKPKSSKPESKPAAKALAKPGNGSSSKQETVLFHAASRQRHDGRGDRDRLAAAIS